MRAKVIDGLRLFVNRVLLGEGIPLSKEVLGPVNLKLLSCKSFLSGVVGLHYRMVKGEL